MMKQYSLLAVCLCLLGMTVAFGQQRMTLTTPNTQVFAERISIGHPSLSHLGVENMEKAGVTCTDTLRYPAAKHTEVSSATGISAYIIEQTYGDKVSQAYHNSGTLTITGAEFFASTYQTSGAVTVQVQVYNVNSANKPTTVLGTTSISITNDWDSGNGLQWHDVVFSTPITVTGNYAMVISPTTFGSMLAAAYGSLTGASTSENLSRIYTDWTYNDWVSFTSPGLYPNDGEPIIHPVVSYSLNLSGQVSPTAACMGDTVVFTNTSTGTNVLNRMTHSGMFRKHWLNTPNDSIFVWSHSGLAADVALAMWAPDTFWVYTTAGNYTPAILFEGGFSVACQAAQFYDDTITNCTLPACSITGGSTVCQDSTLTLTGSAGAGTWTSSSSLASVNSSGVVTAASSGTGTVTISYSSSSCTGTATHDITVNDCTPPPPPCSITGGNTVCQDSTLTLTGSAGAGTWTSSSSLASVNSSGVVTAASSGTGLVTISYSSSSCTGTATHDITVNDCTPPPPPPSTPCSITGGNTVCQDSTLTLTSSAGAGTWTSSNSSLASVNSSGVVTAASSGTGLVTISYSSSSCTGTATHDITVNDCTPTPPPPSTPCSITGETTVCQGNTLTLTGSAGAGTWTSSNPSIASVDNNGVVTAGTSASGTTVISYVSVNCAEVATHGVTVSSCGGGNVPVGVDDIDPFTKIAIFPNPTTNVVSLVGLPDQSHITLTDLNGKILFVQQSNATEETISLGEFVNGIYFIQINSKEINGVQKIILNR